MTPPTRLHTPTVELAEEWMACVADFAGTAMDGSGSWAVTDFGPDRASLEALLEMVRTEGDTTRDLGPDRVHSDYWWITTDGPDGTSPEVVGFVAVRHSIDTANGFLRRQGGHIGYSVAPAHRRRGHAGRALALALDRARELGIEKALVTCADDNAGSAATIEKNGGVLEDVLDGTRRYWIDLN